MKRYCFFFCVYLCLIGSMVAQNSVWPAMPPSFQFNNSLMQPARVCRAVLQQSAEQLLQEDQERVKDGHPLRVAVAVPVDVELNDVPSEWVSLPDGQRIWQQSIKADGAGGLILSFDELYIPEGGVLYVYSADRTQVQRVVHEDNRDGGVYALPRFMDDEVLLEYVQPADGGEAPRIKASGVGYIYRNARALENDLSCFINITCEEGEAWQNQARGVVSLDIELYSQGENGKWGWNWYICSGSIVNNVRQDATPYLLTAHHCIDGYDEDRTFRTLSVYFFLDPSPDDDCRAELYRSVSSRYLTGVELVADNPMYGGSDGTLLKLKKEIPAEWNVHYNGWDVRGELSASGVSIHHPNGMVKKISTYNKPLRSSVWQDAGGRGAINASWEVRWARTQNGHSVTAGGSSGSPLFNEDGLIVGTLSGGNSLCEYPYATDIYGKMSYHWNGLDDTKQHFSHYLDPDNTGTLVLGGYDPQPSRQEDVRKPSEMSVFMTGEHVLIRRASAAEIYVYDLVGRKVWAQMMDGCELQLPKNVLGQGVFCIKAGDDAQQIIIP